MDGSVSRGVENKREKSVGMHLCCGLRRGARSNVGLGVGMLEAEEQVSGGLDKAKGSWVSRVLFGTFAGSNSYVPLLSCLI